MKRIFFLFLLLISGLFLSISSKANAKGFVKLEEGIGRNKLNFDDLDYGTLQDGRTYCRFKGAYPIKGNSVLSIYLSPFVIGDFDKIEDSKYNLYTKDGEVSTFITRWKKYNDMLFRLDLVNDYSDMMYVELTDIGLPYSDALDDPDLYMDISMYEENSVNDCSFDGVWSFIGKSRGYTKVCEDEYTYACSNKSVLTDDSIKKLFLGIDGIYYSSISIEENNYVQSPGNYKAIVKTTDSSKNEKKVTLNILVYDSEGEIIGDDVTIKMSEIKNFTPDKLLSNFSASYHGYSYQLYLDKEDLDKLPNIAYKPSVFVTVRAKFSNGTTASKKIQVKVIDDVTPEMYVSSLTLKISQAKSMSLDDIIKYVENQLAKNNVKARKLVVLADDYLASNKPGKYNIPVVYEVDDKEYYTNLEIVVEKDSTKNFKYKYLVISSCITLLVLSFGGVLIYKKKKKM